MKYITNKLLELLVVAISLPFMFIDPVCSKTDSKGKRCTRNRIKGCDKCVYCCSTHCSNKCKVKKQTTDKLKKFNTILNHSMRIDKEIIICDKCGYKRQCTILFTNKNYEIIPSCDNYIIDQIMKL